MYLNKYLSFPYLISDRLILLLFSNLNRGVGGGGGGRGYLTPLLGTMSDDLCVFCVKISF